jgi:hypothetical protein
MLKEKSHSGWTNFWGAGQNTADHELLVGMASRTDGCLQYRYSALALIFHLILKAPPSNQKLSSSFLSLSSTSLVMKFPYCVHK